MGRALVIVGLLVGGLGLAMMAGFPLGSLPGDMTVRAHQRQALLVQRSHLRHFRIDDFQRQVLRLFQNLETLQQQLNQQMASAAAPKPA